MRDNTEPTLDAALDALRSSDEADRRRGALDVQALAGSVVVRRGGVAAMTDGEREALEAIDSILERALAGDRGAADGLRAYLSDDPADVADTFEPPRIEPPSDAVLALSERSPEDLIDAIEAEEDEPARRDLVLALMISVGRSLPAGADAAALAALGGGLAHRRETPLRRARAWVAANAGAGAWQ